MPTTPNGLTYPDSSGHTRLWEHFQTLALNVDAKLTELLNRGSVWTDYTPNLVDEATATVRASTVTYARWTKIGKTVHVVGSLTNSSGVTCANAAVLLPAAAGVPRDRLFNCGQLLVMGSGTLPADQSGAAYMNAAKDRLVVVGYSGGFRDAANGQIIRWHATYETTT